MRASNSCVLGALASAAPVAAQTVVDDSQCDCFVSNGSVPVYYQQHKFFDFRSLSDYVKVSDVLQDQTASENADFVTSYLNDESDFGQFWMTSSYAETPTADSDPGVYTNQYSKNNLYIEQNSDSNAASDTWLTFRSARPSSAFQSSAEIESRDLHQFASMRMYSRTQGDAGACTAMFTYLGNDDPSLVQESDIEMLTQEDADLIWYTNQPSHLNGEDVPGAAKHVTVPAPWTDWVTHRLDWTPSTVIWSVDGDEVDNNSFQAPKDPSKFILNAWGNGDAGWTGPMKVGGAAYMQIQFIELLIGQTDKSSCSRVCSIDNSPTVGKAVQV